MANDQNVQTKPPRKKRPPPRPVTVKGVERISDRLTRITFGGDRLSDFGPPRPGAHIKLFFPPPGVQWDPGDPDSDVPRPPSRTYTPRRFDRALAELDVEFVHHGAGLASDWAKSAKPGDPMFIGGPGGGYDVPEGAGDIVLVADDTALPAAGTILDSLPPDCRAVVLAEVEDGADERPLTTAGGGNPKWFHRSENNSRPGKLLEQAVRGLAADQLLSHWWIACEAATMRRIRDHLLGDLGLDKGQVHTRGYWRLGETNYPDHDYGDD